MTEIKEYGIIAEEPGGDKRGRRQKQEIRTGKE